MTYANLLTLLAFIIYLTLMLIIGFVTMKKTKKTDDYFLGEEAWGRGSPHFPQRHRTCRAGF